MFFTYGLMSRIGLLMLASPCLQMLPVLTGGIIRFGPDWFRQAGKSRDGELELSSMVAFLLATG